MTTATTATTATGATTATTANTAANTAAAQTVAALGVGLTPGAPTFPGMVRAELHKIVWRRAVWYTLLGIGLLMLAFEALNYFGTLDALTTTQGLGGPHQPPPPRPPAEASSYTAMTAMTAMTTVLSAVRPFAGWVLAIVTVLLISAD